MFKLITKVAYYLTIVKKIRRVEFDMFHIESYNKRVLSINEKEADKMVRKINEKVKLFEMKNNRKEGELKEKATAMKMDAIKIAEDVEKKRHLEKHLKKCQDIISELEHQKSIVWKF